jgi:hypothetical protein
MTFNPFPSHSTSNTRTTTSTASTQRFNFHDQFTKEFPAPFSFAHPPPYVVTAPVRFKDTSKTIDLANEISLGTRAQMDRGHDDPPRARDRDRERERERDWDVGRRGRRELSPRNHSDTQRGRSTGYSRSPDIDKQIQVRHVF